MFNNQIINLLFLKLLFKLLYVFFALFGLSVFTGFLKVRKLGTLLSDLGLDFLERRKDIFVGLNFTEDVRLLNMAHDDYSSIFYKLDEKPDN